MSGNGRQLQTNVVLNDQLQGTVATHLRCGGIVNNQLRNVKKLKSVNIRHS